MSLFDNIARRAQDLQLTEKLMSDDEFISDALVFGGQDVGDGAKVSRTKLLKSNTGWIFACVDAIAKEVANIEFKLFKTKQNDEIEEIEQHEILDLLARANAQTTKFDLLYLSQTDLELVGEAPWFMEFEGGKPINLFLLRPDRLEVLPPSKEGELIGGYKYKVFKADGTFQELKFEPIEVLFLKYPDPTQPFRGKGTITAIWRTFQIDETAEKFNLNFFSNAAVPSSIISTKKKLKKEVRERFERMLKEKYSGFNNAHKSMILEGEVDFKNLSLSQKEMDFINSGKFNRDKIFAALKVPKTAVGLTEDVNRANAEATDLVFSKRTIKPKMQMLVEQLNEFLVPLFDNTGTLFLAFEDPVPENADHKLKLANEGVKGGWLTPNEAREVHGYEALEGGDELKTPQEVPDFGGGGDDGDKSIKVKRLKKKVVIDKGFVRALRKRTHKQRKMQKMLEIAEVEIGKEIEKVLISQTIQKKKEASRIKTKEKVPNPFKADTPEQSRELKAAFQAIQLRVGDEFEKRFGNVMNRIFEDQRMIVLDSLPQKAFEDFRLNEKEQTALTVKKTTPVVMSVISEQSKRAFQLLGQDDRLSPRVPAVADYLEKRVFRFSKEITRETNKKLGKVLAESVREGEGIPAVRLRINKMFDGFASRSERISRSEIIRATSFATEEAYIQSGVVEAKEWLTFIDENTDGECADLDGKIIPLGDTYFKEGDKFGRFQLDYEDVAGPPLHVNCRCTLVPVVVA